MFSATFIMDYLVARAHIERYPNGCGKDTASACEQCCQRLGLPEGPPPRKRGYYYSSSGYLYRRPAV